MRRQTLEEYVGDSDELSAEILADLLDPTRTRGHATFGVNARFENYTFSSKLRFHVSFFFRTAPPAEFRRAEVDIEIEGHEKLNFSLKIYDETGSLIHEHTFSKQYQDAVNAVIAVGLNNIAVPAASTVSRALYRDADIIAVDDRQVLSDLSTKDETRDGHTFYFQSPLRRRPRRLYADSKNYCAVQNFLLEVSLRPISESVIEVMFILRYIAPVLIDRNSGQVRRTAGVGFPTYMHITDRRDRWSVHNLMEVEGKLAWKNCDPAWNWQKGNYAGLYNLTPVGCMAVEDGTCNIRSNCLLLRDWHISAERIIPLQTTGRNLSQSLEQVKLQVISVAQKNGIHLNTNALEDALNIVHQALMSAYRDRLGRPRIRELYQFQEQSLEEGLSSIFLGRHRVLVLQARTAGGKTLAFLLPLLTYSVYEKLTSGGRKGVKALLFYPTTALQNDQGAELFKLLWFINQILSRRGKPIVTMGILHGYIDHRYDSSTSRGDTELRMRCPECGDRLIIRWEYITSTRAKSIFFESVVCRNSQCSLSDPASSKGRILNQMIKASREAVYSEPPDVLIANPDIINARLTLRAHEDPATLTILGKKAYICTACGAPHDYARPPRRCKICGGRSLRLIDPSPPKLIIIDEAHLLRGAFGAQVSHLLSRIEQAIRRLKNLPDSWRPIYFVSSATLNNPRERAGEITATEQQNIIEINAQPKLGSEPSYRIHVFIMPKLYTPQATTARVVEALYGGTSALEIPPANQLGDHLAEAREKAFQGIPVTLAFVNRIAEANELLGHIRSFAPHLRVDGHTTDFKRDRVRVEDEFTQGGLDMVIATKGLEVGVDFDRVNVGIIYGMPFYISDYTQRIGRIGRNQHCIIFNVFMPDKPIDHFYYKNWRLLCDSSLREVHMRSETYRVERNNPEALRRGSQRAVLDMISINGGAERIVDASYSSSASQIESLFRRLATDLNNYVQRALLVRDPNALNVATQASGRFLQELQHFTSVHGTIRRAILHGPQELRTSLHNLRTLEPEVEYQIAGVEQRQRNLLYAFRHSMPGQIISYRGSYFVVSEVDGEFLGQYPQRARMRGGDES